MPREYTEEDVRVRPQGRKSRPRSKDRPEHRDALPGLVLTVDRGRFRVVLADDGTRITAVRARELGRRGIVVGDRVGVSGDTSGTPGSLARIVRVDKRSTALRRTPDDDDATERIVVANAEILGVVVAAPQCDIDAASCFGGARPHFYADTFYTLACGVMISICNASFLLYLSLRDCVGEFPFRSPSG